MLHHWNSWPKQFATGNLRSRGLLKRRDFNLTASKKSGAVQCVHRHRFESQLHAMRVIGDWIQLYNSRRPHQALGMQPPDEAYRVATGKLAA